jgi:hypothetical protein
MKAPTLIHPATLAIAMALASIDDSEREEFTAAWGEVIHPPDPLAELRIEISRWTAVPTVETRKRVSQFEKANPNQPFYARFRKRRRH